MGSGGLGREGGVSRSSGIGGSLGNYKRAGAGTIVSSGSPSASQVAVAVTNLFQDLQRRYTVSRFCSRALREAVRTIFQFEIGVVVNRTWDWAEKNYGVTGDAACLARFVNELGVRLPREDATEQECGFARQCVEDFFIQAVGNKMLVYTNGTSDQVLKELDKHRNLFQQVVTHCLASGIWRLADRFSSRLPKLAIESLQKWSWDHAVKICNRFRTRYVGQIIDGRQVGMQDMIDVFSTDEGAQDWFVHEIRSLE